jgi:predicted nucleic acid-binding protein
VSFLRRVRSQRLAIFCPTLVLPECAAAIARPTGESGDAQELVQFLERFHGMCFVALALPLAERAAEIAVTCRLRGSDCVYVAVAEVFGATLITWDAEMLERAPAVVPTMTPSGWLAREDARP